MSTRRPARLGWLILLALAVTGLLSACDVPPESGVALQAVPTVATPPPVPSSPLLIDHPTLTVRFLYPPGWRATSMAHAMVAYGPGDFNLPQIGARLYYEAADGAGYVQGSAAQFAPTRLLWEPIGEDGIAGRFDAELLHSDTPAPDTPFLFDWGRFDAAVLSYTFHHSGADVDVYKVQVALQIERRGGFLVLWAAVPVAQWAEYEPTILAALGSLRVADTSLSAQPLREALATYEAGEFLTPAADPSAETDES